MSDAEYTTPMQRFTIQIKGSKVMSGNNIRMDCENVEVVRATLYDQLQAERDEYVHEAEHFQNKCIDLDQANGMLKAECDRKDKVIAELKRPIPSCNHGDSVTTRSHYEGDVFKGAVTWCRECDDSAIWRSDTDIKAKDAQLAKYKAALEWSDKQLDWYANTFAGWDDCPLEFEHFWRVELPHEISAALAEGEGCK